jgi:hypothetical protein
MRNKLVFGGESSVNSYRDIEDNANLHFCRKRVFRMIETVVPVEPKRITVFKISLNYENM